MHGIQDVVCHRIERAEQCLCQCRSCKVSQISANPIRSNAEVVSVVLAASAAAANTAWIEPRQTVSVKVPSVPVSVHVARTCVRSSTGLMAGLNSLVVAPEFLGCVYNEQ